MPGYQDSRFLGRHFFWVFLKAVLKDHRESSRSDSSKGIAGLGHVVDPSQTLPDRSARGAIGSLGGVSCGDVSFRFTPNWHDSVGCGLGVCSIDGVGRVTSGRPALVSTC